MGQRAAALEVAVVAYGDNTGELEGVESREDKEWGQRWWLRLLKAIVSEETSRTRTAAAQQEAATVIESQETIDSPGPQAQAGDSEVDALVEEEDRLRRELQQQQEDFDRQKWNYELALHSETSRNMTTTIGRSCKRWRRVKRLKSGTTGWFGMPCTAALLRRSARGWSCIFEWRRTMWCRKS